MALKSSLNTVIPTVAPWVAQQARRTCRVTSAWVSRALSCSPVPSPGT